ncbi:hypothetical protein HNV12_03215 [Methanococcoides sp. SA1]|nr:hypothetical protein [Methanococcoides sp. SA1]
MAFDFDLMKKAVEKLTCDHSQMLQPAESHVTFARTHNGIEIYVQSKEALTPKDIDEITNTFSLDVNNMSGTYEYKGTGLPISYAGASLLEAL